MVARIRVGTTWLDTVAPVGDVEVVQGRHGSKALSWSMALRHLQRPDCLTVRNAKVRAYDGAGLVWSGRLAQPDWNGGRFTAIGIARQGETAHCLTSGLALTTKPNTAIDQAIARGAVDWIRGPSFGIGDVAGPEGDGGTGTVDDPAAIMLDELLDLVVTEVELQWRVQPDGLLQYSVEDTAAPTWLIQPGVGELGLSDDAVADQVFLRYRDSSVNRLRTVRYPATGIPNGVERRASVEKRGAMTLTRAQALCTGMWKAAGAGRLGFTNGLELSPAAFTTTGGQRPILSQVRGGHTVLMRGYPDPRTGAEQCRFVIDEATWLPAEGKVRIMPVGMVARTWEQILTDYRAEAA